MVYGIVGYKTHAKMILVVRRENNKLVRYVHLGTGNYHAGNARIYTDYGLLTTDKDLCEDVHRIFQELTGMGKMAKLKSCSMLHLPCMPSSSTILIMKLPMPKRARKLRLS